MTLPEEPYTRVERYLARLSGQNVDIPEYPITRIECYLDYLCGNGGGVPAPNAGAHNGIFRGQSLGTSFTSAQSQAITSGTFDGLFVGDYWTIEGMIYRIAGFDVFLHRGDTELTSHHAVIVPDMSMGLAPMNDTATTEGGYNGTRMRADTLITVLGTVQAAFGTSHVLERRTLITDVVSSGGVPTSLIWVSSSIDILSESLVYGFNVYGGGAGDGERVMQLPLFALAPEYIIGLSTLPSPIRGQYWLQDIRNSTQFSCVGSRGNATSGGASNEYHVRPYFCIA